MLGRRAFLAASAASMAACSRPGGDPTRVRLGVMTNLTHAPVLAAIFDGSLARAIAPLTLDVTYFRAGPRVTEALLGSAIDVGTAGAGPLISTLNRHRAALVARHCIASGGASLVTRHSITSAAQLDGTTLAVSQLGSTQDVSLRTFIRQRGLSVTSSGGSVRITALAPADIVNQLKRGAIDGAWLAEPWATRAIREGNFVRLIDERDLWPDRYFPTAVLIARSEFALARPQDVATVESTIQAFVVRAKMDSVAIREMAYEELVKQVKNPGSRAIFDEAWSYVDFRSDLKETTMATLRSNAIAAGLLRPAAS